MSLAPFREDFRIVPLLTYIDSTPPIAVIVLCFWIVTSEHHAIPNAVVSCVDDTVLGGSLSGHLPPEATTRHGIPTSQ